MSRKMIALSGCLLIALAVAGEARGQAATPFTGVVTSDDVYVRSGPSKNYYHVGKVNTGELVEVESELYGWYVIKPPAGSYSFISKQFVKVDADGKTGTLTGDNVRVRAPAGGGPSRSYKIQLKLNTGDKVAIVGEQDDYLKIMPPADARLYVFGELVAPATDAQIAAARVAAANAALQTTEATDTPTDTTTATATDPTEAGTETVEAVDAATDTTAETVTETVEVVEATTDTTTGSATGTTETVETTQTVTETAEGTTDPVDVTAAGETDRAIAKLDARFAEESAKPLVDQDVAGLLNAYRAFGDGVTLSPAQRAVVDTRIDVLETRSRLQVTMRQLDEARAKLDADQQALADRTRDYAAIGKLMASSLYTGGERPLLYRLVDPLNGLTIAYVEPGEGRAAAAHLGRVVGVIGAPRYDAGLRLKVIAPQQIDRLAATR